MAPPEWPDWGYLSVRQDSADGCHAPYVFYSCGPAEGGFVGCCRSEACDGGCSEGDKQPPSDLSDSSSAKSATLAAATSTSISQSSSIATGIASATTTPRTLIPSSAATSPNDSTQTVSPSTTRPIPTLNLGSSGANGLSIPIGALVGLPIGLGIVFIVAGIMSCILWRRWRARKNFEVTALYSPAGQTETEKLGESPTFLKPRNGDDCFAEFGGRYDEDAVRRGAAVRDSGISSAAQSTLVSPLYRSSMTADISPPPQPELDSSPKFELESSAPSNPQVSELETPPTTQMAFPRGARDRSSDTMVRASASSMNGGGSALSSGTEPIPRPRATLEATSYERNSQIHVTSWSDLAALRT